MVNFCRVGGDLAQMTDGCREGKGRAKGGSVSEGWVLAWAFASRRCVTAGSDGSLPEDCLRGAEGGNGYRRYPPCGVQED